MFRTSNPVLREDTFAGQRWGGIMNDLQKHEAGASAPALPGTMTIQGTALKTGFLVLLCTSAAVATYTAVSRQQIPAMLPVAGGAIGAAIIALVLCFWQKGAPFLGPIYAVVKGAFLGAITLLITERAGGNAGTMIGQAVGLTLGIALALAAGYAFGLIRIGSTMMKVIIVATVGLMLFYLAQFILGMMGIPFAMQVHQAGPIGIAFSLFVIALASFNLVMTFQFADEGVKNGAPKYMEWYMGFAILVELAWLYLEILKLLDKLRRS
jgi:uncharacterized YccA/Bax inhibitor family protein